MRILFLLVFLCLNINFANAQSYIGWVTTTVNLREGPNSSNNSINKLEPGTQIFISSLKEENGYVNIVDIETNKEGYIFKDYIKLGQLIPKSSEGILQNTGQSSSYQPEIEIFNNTDRSLTLKMNDRKFTFNSKERKTLNLPPGNYEYRASAPGVIPDIGIEQLSNNNGYEWEFYIISR